MKVMKSIFPKLLLSLLFCTTTLSIVYCQLYEWRGPGRTGIYNETGLLKKWPDGGPKLLWEAEKMGDGYSAVTVTDDAVYVTGRKDRCSHCSYTRWESEMGNSLWKSLDD
jgi:outer membrane protein assembly factor BamB